MGAQVRAEKRYTVIERLATGGMAEVFRAEALGMEGFTKQVAIKRVLPHVAAHARFIAMFLDEARLSARLNHRNIAQVFDVGRVEDAYFIVMEFVDGVTLKRAMDHVHKRGETLPVPLAVHVMVEACNGLYYAHRLKDSSGRRLDIVHRDVSPANVLLSRTGGVKIVDFGLAKATSQLERTDPGMLKGKFGYLAPETAAGGDADAFADQFALGIVLWELLAGRRLFTGGSDFETTRRVREADVPSLRSIRPEVPPQLEALVNRALAREKTARFPSVGALSRALTEFLFANGQPVSSEDVAILVHEVLDVRYTSQTGRPERVQAPTAVEQALIEQQLAGMQPVGALASVVPPAPDGDGPGDPADSVLPPALPLVHAPVARDAATSTAGVATATRTAATAVASRGRIAPWIALGVCAVVAGGTWAVGTLPRTHASRATSRPAPAQAPVAAVEAPAAMPVSDAAAAPGEAAPAGEVLAAEPSYRARTDMRHAIEQALRGCEARETERYERHARLEATYDARTGVAREVQLHGDFFASRPIGACIVAAVRGVLAPAPRRTAWSTDYEFMIH